MKNFPRLAVRMLALLLLGGSLGLSSCHKSDDTTVLGDWTVGNAYPSFARNGAASFIIDSTAYVGTGQYISVTGGSGGTNDFYAYNGPANSWSKVTPMPAAAGVRYNAVAFTAGGKGYVGTGYNGSATTPTALSDFWQFDPKTPTTTTVNGVTTTTIGTWTQVADFTMGGGTARYNAVAGSINGIGYVGCGYDGNNEKDFYKYDPVANTWSAINGFPGDKASGSIAFVLNGQMYVGTGTNNNLYNTRFFSYNPVGDVWTQKRNLANQTTGSDTYDYSAVDRAYAVSFTIDGYGYVAVGSNNAVRTDCYQYSPSADTWTLMGPFKGAGRNAAVAFGIGKYAYVGLGYSGSTRFDDFWKFDPSVVQE